MTRPRIEIDADFGGSIGSVTGIFEPTLPDGGGGITDVVRTGFLLSGAGDDTLGFIFDLLDADESVRKGLSIDVGGGEHAVELNAQVTSGHVEDNDGTTLQWGASSDPDTLDETTATGGTARQKAQIFQNYLRTAGGGADSLSPARLVWGEYSPSGVLEDHLDVVIEQPQFERRGPDTFRFSCALVETIDLGEGLFDGSKQTEG